MKNFIKVTKLLLIILFLTSCKTSVKEEIPTKYSQDQNIEKVNKEKNKLEIRVTCEKGGISEYLNDGWVIVKEFSEEKICSWKSFPATKDCDMEKDKGCKITKPDEIGEEKIYILEKP